MFKESLTKKALSLGTALTLSVACVLTSFSTSPAETKAATIPGMSFLSDEINNGDNTTDVDDNNNNDNNTTDVVTGSAIKSTSSVLQTKAGSRLNPDEFQVMYAKNILQ